MGGGAGEGDGGGGGDGEGDGGGGGDGGGEYGSVLWQTGRRFPGPALPGLVFQITEVYEPGLKSPHCGLLA